MLGKAFVISLATAMVVIWYSKQQQTDVICMINHCPWQLGACLTNLDCIRAMMCISPCKTDVNCVMKCMMDYGYTILADFTRCASQDNECLVLPPQEPPFNCSPPTKFDKSLDIKSLPGDWYILLGKNPAYDCYDCQVTTFHPVNTNGSTKTLMKYQVTTSNGEIKNYEQVSYIVHDKNRSEILHVMSNTYGHDLTDEWQIIDQVPDKYFLLYYCGGIPTGGGDFWQYEGAVLYSKTTSLSQEDMEKIKQTAFDAGMTDVSNWCSLSYSHCS